MYLTSSLCDDRPAYKAVVAALHSAPFSASLQNRFLFGRRLLTERWSVERMLDLCWILAIGLSATTTVIAPITFVAVLEQGKSPAEVFALRGRSLPCVSIWTVTAIAASVLAGFTGIVECLEVTALVLSAFIPVYSWRVYFENFDFVEQFVVENKKRMSCLLFDGMGVDENTFEAVSSAVETALVEFFSKKLTKRWTEFNQKDIGKLMFDSGIETARVIAKELENESHWTIFAFLHEWGTYIECIRVPAEVKRELEFQSTAQQFLNGIAVILANETRGVRETRARQTSKVHLPYYPAAGVTARQTAVEGLLSWPDCLQTKADIRIRHVEFKPTDLYHMLPEKQCCGADDIPPCVAFTLKEMIEAGFVHLPQSGKTSVAVSFRNSHVVFERKDWNNNGTIDCKPFRFIVSATRLNGDPAFVIEQREVIDGVVVRNGSSALEGILKVEADVEVREEETWLHHADVRDDDAGIWGELNSFVKPFPQCRLNFWLALSTIKPVCDFWSWLKRSLDRVRSEEDGLAIATAV